MAPKRSTKKKLVGTVVKTTKKFVEETVKVSVEDNGVLDGLGETQTQQDSQPIQASSIVEIVARDEEAREEPKPEEPKKVKSKNSKAQEEQREPTDEKAKPKGRQAQEARVTAQGKTQKGRRRRRRNFAGGEYTEVQGNYKRYVFKVLKQVHPELGMSSRAMTVIDAMMNDMFERIQFGFFFNAFFLCDLVIDKVLYKRLTAEIQKLTLNLQTYRHLAKN
ncbi:histone H2B.2-like [Asparagus officinalis]|uniref:histone H2B.2-like n=1 Tax=Asparagus officinalis TaxID=4686 RepID=UPI00098E401B|nr:histone H2B.2-like [Asparagus officinalis]